MFSKETKEMMGEDIKIWQREKDAARIKISEALEEIDDERAAQVLESCLTYGWRRPNGEWRNSPKYK